MKRSCVTACWSTELARFARFVASARGSGLVILCLAIPLAASTSSFALTSDAAGSPQTMVMDTVARAVEVLSDRQMPQEARRKKLLEVVAGHFDFADMARLSLGYHWRQLTPDQQQRFVQLFTAFIEEAYLNKLDEYQGQKIKYLESPALGPDRAEVKTLVIQPNGQEPINLDYQLKHDGGQWKIYDVTVDSISITANYRNQFNHVINSQGFDALMRAMQAKRQELLASLSK